MTPLSGLRRAVAVLATGAVAAACTASSGSDLTTTKEPVPVLSLGLTPVGTVGSVTEVTDTPPNSTTTTSAVVALTVSTTRATPATTSETTTTATLPVTTIGPAFAPIAGSLALGQWKQLADLIGTVRVPSGCRLPLDEPGLLPNASRSYRGGVHQGVDFGCHERGHDAVAAMSGRVLFVNDTFVDADPADRQAILDDAKALGYTPPWTLAFLFGRFVVLDHGIIAGVGHVVTIYAHLDTVDPALRPGAEISAGTRVGEIGNRGTESAAEATEGQIHLHWELHIDDRFFGEGLSAAETSEVYRELFGLS